MHATDWTLKHSRNEMFATAAFTGIHVYSLIAKHSCVTLVTMKTGDIAVTADVTRGVDDSRLIARTLYARGSSSSVAIVTDLTLLAVVTCTGNNRNLRNEKAKYSVLSRPTFVLYRLQLELIILLH